VDSGNLFEWCFLDIYEQRVQDRKDRSADHGQQHDPDDEFTEFIEF
jgi:hypothetical protein